MIVRQWWSHKSYGNMPARASTGRVSGPLRGAGGLCRGVSALARTSLAGNPSSGNPIYSDSWHPGGMKMFLSSGEPREEKSFAA